MGIEQHEDFWGKEGTDWETTKSADAPLENGCSESLIRSTNISTYWQLNIDIWMDDGQLHVGIVFYVLRLQIQI